LHIAVAVADPLKAEYLGYALNLLLSAVSKQSACTLQLGSPIRSKILKAGFRVAQKKRENPGSFGF